jgi:sRNA-binding regulator protein Hfq
MSYFLKFEYCCYFFIQLKHLYLSKLNLKKMKKTFLFLAMMLTTSLFFAQSDIITKHSGETVKGKVIRVDEYTVVFKYDGEDAENSIGKYAIEKVVYGKSGRVEEVTEKIVVSTEADWEKVIILEEKSYIAGLKKAGEVRGKTGLINFQTGNTGDKKAEKKLKMAAAAIGCPFILMTSDKTTVGANSNAIGGTQAIKTGLAYKY